MNLTRVFDLREKVGWQPVVIQGCVLVKTKRGVLRFEFLDASTRLFFALGFKGDESAMLIRLRLECHVVQRHERSPGLPGDPSYFFPPPPPDLPASTPDCPPGS